MKQQNVKSIKIDLSLLFVGLIWGSGFIVTKYAFSFSMRPSFIMAARFTIAVVAFYIVFRKKIKAFNRSDLKYGMISGTLLFLAFFVQTIGLQYTSPSNSAFLTCTGVIMVPFLSWVFMKRMPTKKVFIAALISLIGVTILTRAFTSNVGLNLGDGLSLLCAFGFAVHMSYLEICTKNVSTEKLTFLQLASAAVLSLIAFFTTDFTSIYDITSISAIYPILYLGLFNICIAYYLQTRAQQTTHPSKVALLLSTESIFASIFSVLLGYDTLSYHLLIGGVLMFAAVVITESKLKSKIVQADEV